MRLTVTNKILPRNIKVHVCLSGQIQHTLCTLLVPLMLKGLAVENKVIVICCFQKLHQFCMSLGKFGILRHLEDQ